MLVVYKGIDCIRWLLNIKAPLLIALGLFLLWWAYRNAGGFGPILSQPSAFDPGQPKAGEFWRFFVPALTGMIGFWATLSLNIPDFSRYAASQRDQILGPAKVDKHGIAAGECAPAIVVAAVGRDREHAACRFCPRGRFDLDRQPVFVAGPVDPDLIADPERRQ